MVLLAACLGAAVLGVTFWQGRLRQADQPLGVAFNAPTILVSAHTDTAAIATDYRLPRAEPGELYAWSVFGLSTAGHCDDMTELLASRIPERRRGVAAAMAELTHLDAKLASLEGTLASGEPQTTLCLGKEEC